jgi:saccharopine dehydrogenase-like NADP-dependent oxidoreductase
VLQLGALEGLILKILVLGGCGLQGYAAVFDLAGSAAVKEVVCADANPSGLDHFHSHVDVSMVRTAHVDAADSVHLRNIFTGMDVVIDLLPRHCM